MRPAGTRLSPAEVESRLSDPARLGPRGRPGPAGPDPRRAAVLVPVLLRPEPSVLLTLRAAHLSAHAGQVALPGGRIEPGETPEAAALREAAEEVGLDPRLPRLIGRLPALLTGTGFHVTPVLGLLDEPPILAPDPGEVEEAFLYPLERLMDPALPLRREGVLGGLSRSWWEWPHERRRIWGATAEILRDLALALRD